MFLSKIHLKKIAQDCGKCSEPIAYWNSKKEYKSSLSISITASCMKKLRQSTIMLICIKIVKIIVQSFIFEGGNLNSHSIFLI